MSVVSLKLNKSNHNTHKDTHVQCLDVFMRKKMYQRRTDRPSLLVAFPLVSDQHHEDLRKNRGRNTKQKKKEKKSDAALMKRAVCRHVGD